MRSARRHSYLPLKTEHGRIDMSEKEIAIVRRLTEEGFVAGKVDVVDELVSEHCVDHDPLPGQGQGREGQRRACQMVVRGLSNRSVEDDVVSSGDRVIESWVFRGTHTGDFMGVPPTGKQITIRGMEMWRLAAGEIVERWGVIDTGGVMEQLGAVDGFGEDDVVDQLSERFAAVFVDPKLALEVFAPDAFFDLNMPVWRMQLSGSAAFAAQLEALNEGEVRVEVLKTVPTRSGFVAEHEEHQRVRGQDISARRMWLCEVADGRIVEAVGYCSGEWDEALRARHALEAPMVRA
jgi:predicted ester cyclase/ketosteroid isomerase-like protein